MKLQGVVLVSLLCLGGDAFVPLCGVKPLQKKVVQENPSSTQLNVVDPISFTASALLGVGLGSPAWAVVALKKIPKNVSQDERSADEDFGAALPLELKAKVQETQPEVNDRVKKMWMNRERMNTVGNAMASSKAAGIAVKKATSSKAPGKAIPAAAKVEVDAVSQAVPKGKPSAPSRPKNIFEEKPFPATSTASVASSPPPPVPAAPNSSSYMASLGGSAAVKKSYTSIKWKPGQTAPTMGGSYLETMSTGSATSVAPSAPVPTTPKKSYAVSSWKPGDKVDAGTGDDKSSTVLSSASGGSAATVPAPVLAPADTSMAPPKSPAPAIAPPAPVSFVSSIPMPNTIPGKSKGGAKQSYSMTSWKPGQKVNRAVSSSYLMNMGDNPVVAPSYPKAASPSSPLNVPSSTTDKESTSGKTKKSYSVSSWKPGSSVPESVLGSSFAAAVETTSESSQPSYAPPAPVSVSPLSYSSIESSSSTDYMSSIDSGIAAGSGPKKSYSMNGWKPGSPVPDVSLGNFYLRNSVSNITPDSTSSDSKASAPVPVPSQEVTASSAGFASAAESGPKKSYNMSQWKPDSPVLNTGVGASFVPGESSAISSPSTAPVSLPDSQETLPSGMDYMSSIGGSSSASSGPKKSYRMTSWKPGSEVPNKAFGASFGPGSAPAVSHSSSPVTVPVMSPAQKVAPSNLDYMSSIGGGTLASSGPKKSYSMSSWKPGSTVASSTLGGFVPGNSAAPKTQFSDKTSTSSNSDYMSSIGGAISGGPKKSYSASSWKPGSTVPAIHGSSFLPGNSAPSPSNAHEQDRASPSPPAMPQETSVDGFMSSISVGSSSKGPKKSYSVSKWKPGSAVLDSPVGSYSVSHQPSANPVHSTEQEVSCDKADPMPSSTDYMSSISGSNGPRKSYNMSSWKPGTVVNDAPVGSSYASSLDNAASAAAPSYSISMNPPSDIKTSDGESSADFRSPKKSYSVSKWKPDSGENGSLDGKSYVYSMDEAANTWKKQPAYSPPTYVPTSSPSFMNADSVMSGPGEKSSAPKKSYRITSWKPGTQQVKGLGNDSSVADPTKDMALSSTSDYMSRIAGTSSGPKKSSRSFALSATPNSDYMSNLEGGDKRAGESSFQQQGSEEIPQQSRNEGYFEQEEYEEASPQSYSYGVDRGGEYGSDRGAGYESDRGGEYESDRDKSFSQYRQYRSDIGGGSDAERGRALGMSGLRPDSGEYDRTVFNTGERNPYSLGPNYGGFTNDPSLMQPGYGGISQDNFFSRGKGGPDVLPDSSRYKSDVGGGSDAVRGRSMGMSGLRPDSVVYDRTMYGTKPSRNPYASGDAGYDYGEYEQSSLKQPGYGGTSQDGSYAPVEGGSGVIPRDYPRQDWAFAPQNSNYKANIGGGPDAARGTSMSGLRPDSGEYDRTTMFGNRAGNPFTKELGSSVGSPDADYLSNVGSNYGTFDPARSSGYSNLKQPGFGGTSQDNSYARVEGGSGVVPRSGVYEQSRPRERGNPFVSELGSSVGDPDADYLSNPGSNYGDVEGGRRFPPGSVFRPPGF